MTDLEFIGTKIYTLRDMKVMLDRDLAELYHVDTRALNQAVKRNPDRFPLDFMFQITEAEWISLRSQIVILESQGRGKHLKYMPYAFTEQGVAMLSTVLKSKIAIEINIRIMRTFVDLRRVITSKPEYEILREKLLRIEAEVKVIHSDHKVDIKLLSDKMIIMNHDIRRISEVFDQFQDAHIVIKRPEDGISHD